MENGRILFAFRLAADEDQSAASAPDAEGQWRARDGVAVAGCTDPTHQGDYRYGTRWSSDNGVWC